MTQKFPPKAIVFDLDGTLVDSSTQIMTAFQHALKPFEIPFTPELLETIRSRTHLNLFDGLLGPESARIAQERLADYTQSQPPQVTLYEGLFEVFDLLAERKIPTAIWTGRDHASTVQILRHFELTRFFSRVVGGCQVNRNKPHPDGLLLLVEHFGCAPGDILMIGDHDHDIQGAKMAGCRSALALWGGPSHAPQEERNPDHVFATTEELLGFLSC